MKKLVKGAKEHPILAGIIAIASATAIGLTIASVVNPTPKRRVA